MAWPKGRPKSEAQRKKLSEALKGRTKTDEHRNKIAAATKARWDRKDPALIAAREAATDSRRLPLGSRTEHADGYWLVKTEKGWELEHRVVMSRKLGRPLLDYEIVHHLDENKKNNDPKNLELTNHQEHSREHQNFRK
jgi:hypothetical protein